MVRIEPARVNAAAGLEFPPMYEARRVYTPDEVPEIPLEDLPAAVRREMKALEGRVKPGESVGIATGSRGIANQVTMIREIGAAIRALGGKPFLMPSMGSHGGASAAGQAEVLLGYGLTPEATEMEIVSDMAVREIGRLPGGMPVWMSVTALEADHVLLVNRIKPHTDWRGPVESGLAKICTIGLGKQHGAQVIHSNGLRGLSEFMTEAARYIVEHTGKVVGGLGILENAYDRTALVRWVEPEGIGGAAEAELQTISKKLLATLAFEDLDVLVIDEMGKDIAGPGMDTNVVGRVAIPKAPQFMPPEIGIVVVLDLTPGSHGNAVGLGVADITTEGMLSKVDWDKVWWNAYTSGVGGVLRAHIPMIFPDDREAIAAAIKMCGQPDPAKVRMVRIKNTLSVAQMQISASLLEEAATKRLKAVGEGKPFEFDRSGRLLQAPWAAHS